MIKLYEEYNKLPKIPEVLKDKIDLNNFISNGDGTFTYNGNLIIKNCNLKELPDLKITKVKGKLDCSNNQLTSLKNCPSLIDYYFWCYNNQLTSLKDCPEVVKESFHCDNNLLLSVKHDCKIGMSFYHTGKYSAIQQPLEKITDDVLKSISKLTNKEIGKQLEFFRKRDKKAYSLMKEALDKLSIDYIDAEDVDQAGMF